MSGLETVEVRLEVLTPLHVGVPREEELVRGLDYRVDGNRILVVDFTTLPPERAERVLGALEGGDHAEAEGYLEGAEVLREVELRTGGVPDRFLPTYRPTRVDDPWIPGTSVKGALRTGLLLAALKRLDGLGTDLSTLTDRLPRNPKKAAVALDNRLRATVFQGGTARRSYRRKPNRGWPEVFPHADVLRALKVEDARPVGKIRTAVYRAELHPKGRPLDAREFVVSGTFELELGTDHGELKRVLDTWDRVELPRLPKPVFRFLRDVRSGLRDFWEETLENPETVLERAREGWREGLRALSERFRVDVPDDADVQLGWGGGRLVKTALPLAGRVLRGPLDQFAPQTVKLVDGEVPGLVRVVEGG
ncbi:type III-A CRISPR-associated RAMP protein Csm5 [Methanopyrus kandleri]|uniref:CRISPR system Cms protein Csm5 n=1 Tax=Methanopyrus kandleri (strain AV19 / DSM 6324 / JCM 9639 / NBRC 100938) TaxID=190192 RepID=Q8TVR9_METKA|nr:type III-A CRISPR-associated RAMP protein Csm5 [Methanopyrus kandleri]AAM02532.1 Predicted component of a thermophile-specific DNA repair system, contains a RAMP domain [Methanopyrus kandleri AV19]